METLLVVETLLAVVPPLMQVVEEGIHLLFSTVGVGQAGKLFPQVGLVQRKLEVFDQLMH